MATLHSQLFSAQFDIRRIREQICYLRHHAQVPEWEPPELMKEYEKKQKKLKELLIRLGTKIAGQLAQSVEMSIVCGKHWAGYSNDECFKFIYQQTKLHYGVSIIWSDVDCLSIKDYIAINCYLDYPQPHAAPSINTASIYNILGKLPTLHFSPTMYLNACGSHEDITIHLKITTKLEVEKIRSKPDFEAILPVKKFTSMDMENV